MEEILAVSVGYVVGSVPFAYLIAQRRGVDLRRAGSGNVGAANVLRTSGMPSGLAAMCLDLAKGAVVVVVVQRLCSGSVTPVLAGLSAVIGHVYPVWLGFRGGKGVATAAGVFMMLAPVAVAMAATVFVMVTWVTRYISVGSMSAAATLVAAVAASNVSPAVTVGSAVAGVIIVVRHRDNIGRLRAGTERRVGERLR
jgi:acyl phosphate:glycerol-3-phosphate acyltransferase